MNEPLLPGMPGTKLVGVPRQYHGHRLLSLGPYFTLPMPLLEQIVTEVGRERFDSEMLEMERALSAECKNHDSKVGFWGGQPIEFLLLRPNNDSVNYFPDDWLEGLPDNCDARASLAIGSQRLNWSADVRRGYCGWLMTNLAFLDEHRQIFEDWTEETADNGIPNMGPVVPVAEQVADAQRAEGDTERFIEDFEQFFIRWRLDGMPAPFVPQPLTLCLPVTDLRPVLGHMRHGGKTFYIPDICPVPSRDKLRQMLEESLRERSGPDYLAEWFDIVHSDNVAKNQIPRYARIFEIQHYLRALYERHAAALQRKKSAMIIALAEFFRVSDDSIERDLRFIASRLGPDWHLGSA